MIPAGAERVLSARQSGHRPSEAVVCSLVGSLPVEWLVEPDLDTEHDLMWAIDLDVWVICTSKQLPRLKPFLWQFKKHKPHSLWVLVEDKQKAFEVFFSIKLETLSRPITEWEWEMEKLPLLKVQAAAMRSILTLEEQA